MSNGCDKLNRKYTTREYRPAIEQGQQVGAHPNVSEHAMAGLLQQPMVANPPGHQQHQAPPNAIQTNVAVSVSQIQQNIQAPVPNQAQAHQGGVPIRPPSEQLLDQTSQVQNAPIEPYTSKADSKPIPQRKPAQNPKETTDRVQKEMQQESPAVPPSSYAAALVRSGGPRMDFPCNT